MVSFAAKAALLLALASCSVAHGERLFRRYVAQLPLPTASAAQLHSPVSRNHLNPTNVGAPCVFGRLCLLVQDGPCCSPTAPLDATRVSRIQQERTGSGAPFAAPPGTASSLLQTAHAVGVPGQPCCEHCAEHSVLQCSRMPGCTHIAVLPQLWMPCRAQLAPPQL